MPPHEDIFENWQAGVIMTKAWIGVATIAFAASFCGSASAVKASEDYSVKACALIGVEQVAAILGVGPLTSGRGNTSPMYGEWICGFFAEGQNVPTSQFTSPGDGKSSVQVTLHDDEYVAAMHESEPSEASMTLADYYRAQKKGRASQAQPAETVGEDSFFARYPASQCVDTGRGYSGADSFTFLKGSVFVSITADCGPTPLDTDKFVAIAKAIADGL